jgi:hypothetical protein
MNVRAICSGVAQLACPERVAYRERLKIIDTEITKGRVRSNGAYVKALRSLAKAHWSTLTFGDVQMLLQSDVYEERLCAVLGLICMHEVNPKQAYEWYVANLDFMYSWELIDLAGGCQNKICGEYLRDKDKTEFMKFSESPDWWKRRLTMNASWTWMMRDRDFKWVLGLAKKFVHDPHHLVRQVAGCVLRQLGLVDREVLSQFLLDPANHPIPGPIIKLATYEPQYLVELQAPALELSKKAQQT